MNGLRIGALGTAAMLIAVFLISGAYAQQSKDPSDMPGHGMAGHGQPGQGMMEQGMCGEMMGHGMGMGLMGPGREMEHGQGMMSHGMGQGAMRHGHGSMEHGMAEQGMMPGQGLMGMLHRWGMFFFTRGKELGLTEDQTMRIESILRNHIKFALRNDADRKILLMEIEDALMKDPADMGEAEKKITALGSLNTTINMEGIRTLQEAFSVLNPDQQRKMKGFFRESTFPAFMTGRHEAAAGGVDTGGAHQH